MKVGKYVGLAALAGSGFAAYKAITKVNNLKANYDKVISFSGKEEKYDIFEGDSIAVMFAGVEIDLSEAEMVGETATLHLHAEFAGVEIKVPEDWNVKVEGTSDKAGVENRTEFDEEDETSKLLVITYDIKFAGLEIKRAGHDEDEENDEEELDLIDEVELDTDEFDELEELVTIEDDEAFEENEAFEDVVEEKEEELEEEKEKEE